MRDLEVTTETQGEIQKKIEGVGNSVENENGS